ncbi:MAG: hypothetical protein COY66_04985 [Candidatus Kerfeldbacteria bacterium CG_4_10_14_0_8_um_filter_42_10]|uniref:Uncharacterized protein n=1 Tax=Candidatus Kerfeldbacteria bacterium CG_4_10_14_0_8_um_filter_42_10 TaxID=2014248 RepID=A0A2M7RH56_9BACT|nr:MAG: hypothetical protein COY66_04985 [Candidatus Kerfeldbacteria bacterium CG_4_10_14_0_8_um_filter_42_10]
MAKAAISTSNINSDQYLRNVLGKIQDTFCYTLLNSAGLAIGSSSKAAVLIANTIYGSFNGAVSVKTTAEIALAGTVTNAKFNVFVLTLKSDGTVTATMGTEGATIGAVVLPAIPTNEAVIGMVIINPTGTGNFVGGTTELDDATVAPNAVYLDMVYPINWTLMENL